MALFTVYTYQFSPVTEIQGELFPDTSCKSLTQLHAERHQILGTFFNTRSRYFSLHAGGTDYGCMMLANRDGVVVLRIANEKHDKREIHFKVFSQEDQPSCLVIIDNREGGMQTVCVQNKSKSFSKTQHVAMILESALNDYLLRYRQRVSIKAKYVTSEFWNTLDKYPQGIERVEFHFPYPNMPQISSLVSDIEQLAWQTKYRTGARPQGTESRKRGAEPRHGVHSPCHCRLCRQRTPYSDQAQREEARTDWYGKPGEGGTARRGVRQSGGTGFVRRQFYTDTGIFKRNQAGV